MFLDSSQSVHQTGCFTGTSTVKLSTGETRLLSELKIGEKVLSMDSNGNLVYSEVFMFLDRCVDQLREFIRIETDSGASITATPSHLIYVWRSIDKKSQTISDYKYADHIQINDFVLVNVNGLLKPQKVINIKNELHRGIYAPLTYDGTIIVNSVSASCYAMIDRQSIAHISFAPMRMFYSTIELFSTTNSNSIEQNQLPNGIHWYARALNKFKDICLPSKWFYQT